MTCKDCIHFEVCDSGRHIGEYIEDDGVYQDGIEKQCVTFRDKESFIELPERIGTTVYCIMTPCSNCSAFNEPLTEEYLDRCRRCEKAELGEMAFDYEMIPEVGETVFFDLARAEEALAIWHKKKTDEKEGNEDGTESGNE